MADFLMLPSTKKVERFDLITREGKTYRYPQPNWLDRFAAWLHSASEPLVASAIIIGIICFAGAIAEGLESFASDVCRKPDSIPNKPIV